MSSIKHVFSYTATYADGTSVTLDHNLENDDFSQLKEGGSRFTDVLKKEEDSPLISFVLHNDKVSAGVDLRDGHFELNGIPFFLHRPDMENYKDFRIIYFRTVRRTMQMGSNESIGEVLQYAIGWQVTHKGQNVQKTIFV